MNLTLPPPAPTYDLNDQAQVRRLTSAAFLAAAALSQLGYDAALVFANLPTNPPAGTRRFVTDRGAHGKPVWRTADGNWVDGTGTVVT